MMTPSDYLTMYDECSLSGSPVNLSSNRAICKVMVNNQITYWGVQKATGIPWLVIAGIHFRESSQNFKRHLHNGDPLTARTTHVPEGRPTQGEPPFTWTASAIDAMLGRSCPFAWDVGSALAFCERYNGMGYQKRGVMSPYVWGGTDKYNSGLYVADGVFDPARADPRPGVAALFKTLESLGIPLDFKAEGAPALATIQ